MLIKQLILDKSIMPYMTSNNEYNRLFLNIINDLDIVYDHQTIITYIKNNEKSPQFIDHINSLGISCFFIIEDDKMYIDSSIYTFDIFDNSIVNKTARYNINYRCRISVLIQ